MENSEAIIFPGRVILKAVMGLTVKERQEAPIASARPFLVSCRGPNLKRTYEYPVKDGRTSGRPSKDGGGVRVWTTGGTPSVPRAVNTKSSPDRNIIRPSWSWKTNQKPKSFQFWKNNSIRQKIIIINDFHIYLLDKGTTLRFHFHFHSTCHILRGRLQTVARSKNATSPKRMLTWAREGTTTSAKSQACIPTLINQTNMLIRREILSHKGA